MGDHSYPLSQSTIDADLKAIAALAFLPDYQPTNPAFSREALLLLVETFAQARSTTTQLDQGFEHARYVRKQGYDVLRSTAMQVHEAALGFKEQVVAQYGKNSRAVELVGLVRKSDRRKPARKQAAE